MTEHLCQMEPKLEGTVLGWSLFKNGSTKPIQSPRWQQQPLIGRKGFQICLANIKARLSHEPLVLARIRFCFWLQIYFQNTIW